MHVPTLYLLPALGLRWGYVASGIGVFLGTFIASLLVIGILLVKLPPGYFLDSHDRDLWVDHHPVIRGVGIVAKNLLGVALILVGLALSVPGIPGQGLLTILIGLMLLDFPGKRRLERWLLCRPRIWRNVNRLRHRFGKPPLEVEEPPQAA